MQAYRISPCTRLAGCGPTPSPRTVPTFFPIIPSELTPLLRLLATPSGVTTAIATATAPVPVPVPVPAPLPSRRCGGESRSKNAAPYPRFDVKETAIAYELQGEFPGFKHEDISIDFVDADTLVIRGHNAGVIESKNQSSAEVNSSKKEEEEVEASTPVAAAESPNTTLVEDEEKKSSNPYKVMVEDEDEEFVDAGAEVSDSEATPATSIVEAKPTIIETTPARQEHSEKDGQGKEEEEEEEESKVKYWIHERATGRFERGFRFPSLVDRDNVKANLKDGVLSIVVPKVEKKERRIVVE